MKKFIGIVESTSAPSTDYLWLCDGDARYFCNGVWKSLSNATEVSRQEDKINHISKELRTANNDIHDLEYSKLTYIRLLAGNSNKIKETNLSALNNASPIFFTEVDSGYGVGTYKAGVGGIIHTITVDGASHYTIFADGSISKDNTYKAQSIDNLSVSDASIEALACKINEIIVALKSTKILAN